MRKVVIPAAILTLTASLWFSSHSNVPMLMLGFVALLSVAVLVGAFPAIVRTTEKQSHLQGLIDPPSYATGNHTWLGGDCATSISWNETESIWLFGDTFIGHVQPGTPCRKPVAFIHNTIGKMARNLDDNQWEPMVKYQGGPRQGPFKPVFEWPDEQYFFWPLSGARIGNSLFVVGTYSKEHAGLNVAGSAWALVANPEQDPAQWMYTLLPRPNTSQDHTWSTAVVVDPSSSWVYVIGEAHLPQHGHSSVILRIKEQDVLALDWEAVQFWTASGWSHYSEGLQPLQGLPPASEASVYHHPQLGWYTVQIPMLVGKAVSLYTSDVLTGPWKEHGKPLVNLTLPWQEPTGDDFFFYAAKAHPELQEKGTLVITYNINTFNSKLLLELLASPEHRALYVPQFVTADIPETVPHH